MPTTFASRLTPLLLRIFDYMEKAVFEREWNEVTRQCRGLVIDRQGRILARPYAKFFSYSEHPEGTFDPDDGVVGTDKLDGSLGILYPLPDGGHAIATRGSFASDRRCTQRGSGTSATPTPRRSSPGLPTSSRSSSRRTGSSATTPPWTTLSSSAASTSPPVPRCPLTSCRGTAPASTPSFFSTLGDALAASPRPGAEGFVLRFPGHDNTVIKIKQDDYVALHRITTGLNARAVWEQLGAGDTVAEREVGRSRIPCVRAAWPVDGGAARGGTGSVGCPAPRAPTPGCHGCSQPRFRSIAANQSAR